MGRGAFMGCEKKRSPERLHKLSLRGLAWDVIRAWPVCGNLELYSGLHFKCVDGGIESENSS